jgi:hypothetical protein
VAAEDAEGFGKRVELLPVQLKTEKVNAILDAEAWKLAKRVPRCSILAAIPPLRGRRSRGANAGRSGRDDRLRNAKISERTREEASRLRIVGAYPLQKAQRVGRPQDAAFSAATRRGAIRVYFLLALCYRRVHIDGLVAGCCAVGQERRFHEKSERRVDYWARFRG